MSTDRFVSEWAETASALALRKTVKQNWVGKQILEILKIEKVPKNVSENFSAALDSSTKCNISSNPKRVDSLGMNGRFRIAHELCHVQSSNHQISRQYGEVTLFTRFQDHLCPSIFALVKIFIRFRCLVQRQFMRNNPRRFGFSRFN